MQLLFISSFIWFGLVDVFLEHHPTNKVSSNKKQKNGSKGKGIKNRTMSLNSLRAHHLSGFFWKLLS